MMKKILSAILCVGLFISAKAQFPVPVPDGGKANILYNQGTYGTTTGFTFITNFSDTTEANTPSYIKGQPGIIILVNGSQLWIRNQTASAWVQATGGGSSSYTASNGVTLSGSDFQLGASTLNGSALTSNRYINTRGDSIFLTSRTTKLWLGADSSIAGGAAFIEFKGPYGGAINFRSDTSARTFNSISWYKQGNFNGAIGHDRDGAGTFNHLYFDDSHDANGFKFYAFEFGGTSSLLIANTGVTYAGLYGVKRFGIGLGTNQVGANFHVKGTAILSTDSAFVFTRVGSSSDSVLVKSAANGGEIRAVAQSSIAGQNIYNTDGTLTANRTMTMGSFKLTLSSTSGTTPFNVTNSNGTGISSIVTNGTGIYGETDNTYGVYGVGGTGLGVLGQSTSNYGVSAISSSGVALNGQTSTGSTGATISVDPTSTNTVVPIIQLSRTTSSTAATNIGGSIEMYTETDNGNLRLSNSIVSQWATVTDASRTSQMIIRGINAGTTTDLITAKGGGQINLGTPGTDANQTLNIQSRTNTANQGIRIWANNLTASLQIGYQTITTAGQLKLEGNGGLQLLGSSSNVRMNMLSTGFFFFGGSTSPTAVVHIAAGTATANTSPLKFTSGTNLTTAEAGAMEYDGTNLFFSPSTTRYTVDLSLTGSATLDFASTGAQSSADLTITVTGASSGDVVTLGVPNGSTLTNSDFTAWVSSANTVTVRFNNYSSGAQDPASGTFKVRVIKP